MYCSERFGYLQIHVHNPSDRTTFLFKRLAVALLCQYSTPVIYMVKYMHIRTCTCAYVGYIKGTLWLRSSCLSFSFCIPRDCTEGVVYFKFSFGIRRCVCVCVCVKLRFLFM